MTESFDASCPYCGEAVELVVDTTAGDSQRYTEDCPVCCRPWVVIVGPGYDGAWTTTLQTEDE
ncbi:MAG: CPXCG motif-containing cysteine-rich protein [Ignavibacteria bacterium]|nr:CPXCG motif-containing cysteine-rich protein [Ignavibacteria bacterium]